MTIVCKVEKQWLSLALLFATAGLLGSQSASATPKEDYEKGCHAYQARQFQLAATHLAAASSMQPTHWPSLYQLGNTLVQMKQYGEARDAYARCAALKPPTTIAEHCKVAIARLTILEAQEPLPEEVASHPAQPAQQTAQQANPSAKQAAQQHTGSPQKIAAAPRQSAADQSAKTGGTSTASTSPAPPESAIMKQARAQQELLEQEAEMKRQKVLDRAEAEVKRIADEGEQRIKAARETASQWYIHADGSLGVDLHEDQEKAMKEEIQEQIGKVRSEAERKVAEIKVPSIHQMASDLESHMTSSSKAGTKLRQVGTSLHVRHYQ